MPMSPTEFEKCIVDEGQTARIDELVERIDAALQDTATRITRFSHSFDIHQTNEHSFETVTVTLKGPFDLADRWSLAKRYLRSGWRRIDIEDRGSGVDGEVYYSIVLFPGAKFIPPRKSES